MKIIAQLFLLLFLSIEVTAQKDTLGSSKYNCTINFIDSVGYINGEIYSANDSCIEVKIDIPRKHRTSIKHILIKIPVARIDTIFIIKNNSFIKNVITYSLIGAATCIIGPESQDVDVRMLNDRISRISSPSQSSEMLLTLPENDSIFSDDGDTIFRSLIKILSDNRTYIIPLHGNIENFNQRKNEILSYSIKR